MQYLNGSGVVKEWEHFYLRLSGFLYIPDSGQYTFYLAADDGGALYIDGERQLDDTGVHGMVTEQRPTWLSSGYHQIQINMQQKTGDRGLELSIRGPSYLDPELYKKQPVRTEWLWNGNPCGDESGFGIDVPLDIRDVKVPRSPLCASHGVCEADCPKSHEHGSCYRHTCLCDNGYKLNAAKSCEKIPPVPDPPQPVNGALVVLLILLGLGIVGAGLCFWKRKQVKQYVLWKFASARFYSSMKPSLDAEDQQVEDDDGRSRKATGLQNQGGYSSVDRI